MIYLILCIFYLQLYVVLISIVEDFFFLNSNFDKIENLLL